MRVGITGGTGFLGRRLAEKLLAAGNDVTVFSRNVERARSLLSPRIRLDRWNPVLEPLSPTRLDPLDAVVNLVGETAAGLWTRDKKRRIWESRIAGTRNLMEGWKRSMSPPETLLSSSACGFYGDGGERELTENSPAGHGFMADLCRRWEEEAKIVEELGTRLVLLRTTLPLDPAGGLLGAMLPAFRLGLGVTLGTGRQWFPWIHMDDWLNLVTFALERDTVEGPLNLSAPNPVRTGNFTSSLGKTLRRPVFFRAPVWLLRLFEPGRELALPSQRVVPAKAAGAGFTFGYSDLEPALRDVMSRR